VSGRRHQHRLGRGFDGRSPGRLFGLEGRHRRHDAPDRTRPRRARIRVVTIAPGSSTRRFCPPADPVRASLGKQVPFRSVLAVRGIRGAGAPHHRERDAERRDDPARRRDPDAAPVVRAARRRGAGAPPSELRCREMKRTRTSFRGWSRLSGRIRVIDRGGERRLMVTARSSRFIRST